MINDKYSIIPLKIGEFIIDNSLFKISGLILHGNIVKSYPDNNIKRKEDIDVGVCGIILFLIELNKTQTDPKFQKALQDAGEDLVNHCKTSSRSHYGFYKGRSGVCYTLIELSEALRNGKYLDFAFDLIKYESETFIQSEFTSNRLYDGRSGLLLLLLHLYNKKPEYLIFEKINLCIDAIISDFVFTEQGIIWNKRDINIQPLNSFLFGSSGVAFVLVQVAEFFNNSELLYMAKSIFTFEDQQWNDELSNWPDFRKEIFTGRDYQIHKGNYLGKNYSFFTTPSESYDWAYGTTGLCMARLPTLDKEDTTRFKSLIERGISKLLDFKTENLSLASGISGVCSLYIEALKYLNVSAYNCKLLEIANTLNNKELSFQDISLLNGITGVGYFLLQLRNPKDFQSVLLPTLENNNLLQKDEIFKINCHEFIIKSLQLNFPYTFVILQTITPNHYKKLIKESSFQSCNKPFYFIRKFISSFEKLVPQKRYQLICDVFALELAKLNIFIETKSYSMNHIKEIVKFEEKVALMNMEEPELFNQSLVFEEDSQIVSVGWNWGRLNQKGADQVKIISEFLSTKPKKIKLLLFRNSSNEIIEEKLDTFGRLTQVIFQEPKLVRKAINEYLDAFEIKSDEDKGQILTYAKQYINYYIKKSLLHRRMQ